MPPSRDLAGEAGWRCRLAQREETTWARDRFPWMTSTRWKAAGTRGHRGLQEAIRVTSARDKRLSVGGRKSQKNLANNGSLPGHPAKPATDCADHADTLRASGCGFDVGYGAPAEHRCSLGPSTRTRPARERSGPKNIGERSAKGGGRERRRNVLLEQCPSICELAQTFRFTVPRPG